MAHWLVEICGDTFDIEEFPHWFPSSHDRAFCENGKVFLVGDTLDALADASHVHDAATQLVDEFYAIIRLIQPSLRKPTIGVVFHEDDQGNRQGFALLSGIAEGRSKLHATLSTSGEPASAIGPTQAQRLLSASRTDRRLRVASSLTANPEATWPHLYRCIEEVEYYLGRKVSDAGFCTNSQRERFTRTANAAEVSGREARHRLEKFKPPIDPMSISEARAFASEMLQAVLRTVPETDDAV